MRSKDTEFKYVPHSPEAEVIFLLPKTMHEKAMKSWNPRLKDELEIEVKGTLKFFSLEEDVCRFTLSLNDVKIEGPEEPASLDTAVEYSRKRA